MRMVNLFMPDSLRSSPDGATRNPGEETARQKFLDFVEPVLSTVEGLHPGYN
jgi:hypothetical protein